jgi:hypothetical protein
MGIAPLWTNGAMSGSQLVISGQVQLGGPYWQTWVDVIP